MCNQSREITVRIEFTPMVAKYNYLSEDFYEEEMDYFEPEPTDFISSMRELNFTEYEDLFDGAERWISYSPPTMELTFFSKKSNEELKELLENIAGQMSDGWGEGYEQESFRSDEGEEVFVSPVWDEIIMLVDGEALQVEKVEENFIPTNSFEQKPSDFVSPMWTEIDEEVKKLLDGELSVEKEVEVEEPTQEFDMKTVKELRQQSYQAILERFNSTIKSYLMEMLSDAGLGEYAVRTYLQSLADTEKLNSVLVFAVEEALIREGVLSEDIEPFYLVRNITDEIVLQNLMAIAVRRFVKALGGKND
jgi:hypothetical protein